MGGVGERVKREGWSRRRGFIYAYSCLDGKEFSCNAGDPGSIPGSGRSPGDLKLTSHN